MKIKVKRFWWRRR